MLQLSASQKAALLALRHKYISSMEQCARQRQKLLQQMQSSAAMTCVDSAHLAASHDALEDIAKQLQECVAQEHLLLAGYMRSAAHEVMLARWHC